MARPADPPPPQEVKTTDQEPAARPRDRLLAVAKVLFAHNGYEATSTSSLAREAGTSESQLVRYFGSKAGLLEEIFNVSWAALHERIGSEVIAAPSGREAILVVLETMIEAFRRDEDLACIFLFEGRRIRGAEHEVFVSEGFQHFIHLLEQLILRGRADGSFKKELPEAALVSALIGGAEGMIRDRLTAARLQRPDPFSTADIRQVFAAILEGL